MRSLLAVWLIALFSLTNSSAVSQPSHRLQDGKPITVDAYWNLVRQTRQALLQAAGQPEPAAHQKLSTLASQWDQVTAVTLSDGSVIQVDSTFLTSELRTEPRRLERLAHLLDALLRAHEEYPQNVFTLKDISPLKEILARPEFQWREQQQPQMPGWLVRFFDWIERLINRILSATLPLGRIPLIVIAAVLFAVSLFFISRSLARNLVHEAQLEPDDGESDSVLTSKGALKRAETLSLQGDYRNAIRYLYLSSLLVLDEQGLLRYDHSRTNREVLRSVASHPELANPLRDVIDVFDRVWYGFEPVDEETYRSYVNHVHDLREQKE